MCENTAIKSNESYILSWQGDNFSEIRRSRASTMIHNWILIGYYRNIEGKRNLILRQLDNFNIQGRF